MDIWAVIAEGKIKESIEKGEFKDLPGQGKPLQLQDLSHIPEELRVGYTLLKNAGVLPEEMELKKEIISLHKLISSCYDEEYRNSIQRKINEKILRFNIMMEKKAATPALSLYKDKVYQRFGG